MVILYLWIILNIKKTQIFLNLLEKFPKDKNQNSYEFSQIYIDEKKKEIIGSNAKAFLNQEDFKIDKRNKPRIFSNTINFKENDTKFIKVHLQFVITEKTISVLLGNY